MNRDLRTGVLVIGLLLTLFATFCMWFIQYQMPGSSPSDVPMEYWSVIDRTARHQVGVVGVPLLVGHYLWLLFAWRLVRRMNQMETAGGNKVDQTEPDK